jgi:hypothetical protein
LNNPFPALNQSYWTQIREPGQLSGGIWRWVKMGKLIVCLAMLGFFMGFAAGCSEPVKQEQGTEQSIGLRKQHDTRFFILCKNGRGEYYEKSLHKSDQITCGEKTFQLEDFENICKTDCYIAFPGKEKELSKYLKKMGKGKSYLLTNTK